MARGIADQIIKMDRGRGPGLSVKVPNAVGNPVEAQVWIPQMETEELDRRTTKASTGRYYRPLKPGKYNVVVPRLPDPDLHAA